MARQYSNFIGAPFVKFAFDGHWVCGLTARVSGGQGAGWDSIWEQEKLEARKLPENAQTPTTMAPAFVAGVRVHAVLGGVIWETTYSMGNNLFPIFVPTTIPDIIPAEKKSKVETMVAN